MASADSASPADSLQARLGIDGIFQHAPMAMVVVNVPQRRVVTWNPAASNLFGLSRARARRLPFERLFAHQAQDRIVAAIEALQFAGYVPWLDDGASLELPSARRTVTGVLEEMMVELHLLLIKRPPGAGRHALALIHEISSRRPRR